MVATFVTPAAAPAAGNIMLDKLLEISNMLDDVLENLLTLPVRTQHKMMAITHRATHALNNVADRLALFDDLKEILKKMQAGAPAGIHPDWWRMLNQHAVVAYNIADPYPV